MPLAQECVTPLCPPFANQCTVNGKHEHILPSLEVFFLRPEALRTPRPEHQWLCLSHFDPTRVQTALCSAISIYLLLRSPQPSLPVTPPSDGPPADNGIPLSKDPPLSGKTDGQRLRANQRKPRHARSNEAEEVRSSRSGPSAGRLFVRPGERTHRPGKGRKSGRRMMEFVWRAEPPLKSTTHGFKIWRMGG